ncbi:MAG: hypothetical protein ACQEWG_09680 [Bacteroidota bacterium]
MKQSKSRFNLIRRIIGKPAVAGFISFLFFLFLGFLLLFQRYQILNEGEQQEMSNILGLVENNIDQSLQNSYSVVLSLALLIDNDALSITSGNMLLNCWNEIHPLTLYSWFQME